MPNPSMFDVALLLAQIVAMAGVTGWLTTGVRDNILYPSQNEAYTAEVMEMTRLRDEYPEAFAPVAHRAITDRRTQLLAFRVVVMAEVLATLLLWLGTGALVLALFGGVALETARGLSLIGAAAFTSVWAGFLVAGNHFCYWFGHEGTQNTHFNMTIWGVGSMLLLAMG